MKNCISSLHLFLLGVDSGGRPESGGSEEDRSGINGIQKRVTGRT